MNKYLNKQQLILFSKSLKKTRSLLGRSPIAEMTPSYGVAGNTFRAYRGWRHSPSETYRAWAEKYTHRIIKDPPTESISTQKKFQQWHKSLYDSLNRYWKKRQDNALSLAHCYKLIDLYIKWASQFDFDDDKFITMLNKHASCALDRQTIERLNKCYSYCLPISSPRMGDIINQNTYDYCQEIIYAFCKEAGGTKLEFDYWAWERGG